MRLSTKQYTQLARLIPLYCAIAAAEKSSGLRDTICACMRTYTLCVFLCHIIMWKSSNLAWFVVYSILLCMHGS